MKRITGGRWTLPTVIGLLLVLIAVSGWLVRRYVHDMEASMSTVVEDRLFVESYIYDLSGHLYRKRELMHACPGPEVRDYRAELQAHDERIAALLAEYERTRFTAEESASYRSLTAELARIRKAEGDLLVQGMDGADAGMAALDRSYGVASRHLDQLSAIQVKEGRRQFDLSRRLAAGSSLLGQLEVILLIGLGMLLHALLRHIRPIPSRLVQQPGLN
ncbi:MAG: MCP four helix bundle domain-containing protein [Saprospiraceae bacterium]|nr:MCP four helix bundle domain-containing protein [Saprospiraceae bacterium]